MTLDSSHCTLFYGSYVWSACVFGAVGISRKRDKSWEIKILNSDETKRLVGDKERLQKIKLIKR